MVSIAGQVLAIATAGILFVGYLEFGFYLLRHRARRVWIMLLVGCAVIALLSPLPAAVSGSQGGRLPSFVLLWLLLALWTIIRARLRPRCPG